MSLKEFCFFAYRYELMAVFIRNDVKWLFGKSKRIFGKIKNEILQINMRIKFNICSYVNILIIVFFFLSMLSCDRNANNDKINKDLENEFLTKIKQDKANYFEYQHDGLVPQKSYFVKKKLKYLTFRHGPEIGFVEGRIVFDLNTDAIEKYTLRQALPNFTNENDNNVYDTIFVFYPKKNLTETYFDDKLINSTNRQTKYNEHLEFINELKCGTQIKYKQK